MPYYCTVPRCTSMAGKAKNVSFHQFPRDEELAKLWNNILKRGKPYTKYSKVCSLHFTPQDYTITSVGKNKGQWRTLRKDAIPSQNLPSESPTPYQRKQWSTWNHGPNNIMDPAMQQQMAQAIYMQTMLAMQTSSSTDIATNGHAHQMESAPFPHTSNDTDILKGKHTNTNKHTYKCTECSKCFKDPDVFILHKRAHIKHEKNEKENFNLNLTLQANPILANLLKTNNEPHIFDNGALTVENLLMTALAANVEGYMRNLSAMIKNDGVGHDGNELANDRDGFSHDRGELDYKRDVDENDGSSDERDESYERDVVGRERDKDHERDVVGHDRDVVGHETDVVDYERDEVGHETDVVECERDEVGHERDGVDHELDGVGHERDSVAHDRNELDHDQDVLSSNGGEFYHSKDVGHQRNGLGHQRDGLSYKRDGLDHERDGLGHESLGLNHYINGSSHNGNPWNEYKSLEITAQNNHNRDEVNRDELYNHRGIFNSDNNSDINQVYKKTSKTIRYNDNGFDNSDNETDGYDNTDNDNIDNSRVICDREMNESIDSDSLVIDETI